MPTILKIEHGTIDGRGRFHKSKSRTGARSLLGTPHSTRSVSRIRTANPVTSRYAVWAGEKDGSIYRPDIPTKITTSSTKKGHMEFRSPAHPKKGGKYRLVGMYGTKQEALRAKKEHDRWALRLGTVRNPAAQLKALLGEGKWTQAKVRPIKGGKVQVLLTQRENPKAGVRGLSEEDIAAVKRDLPSLVAKRGKKTYTVKLGGRLNEKASAAVTDERRGSGRGVWWAPVMGPIFHVSWEAAARAYKTGKPLKV